jgi:hypothetical protein
MINTDHRTLLLIRRPAFWGTYAKKHQELLCTGDATLLRRLACDPYMRAVNDILEYDNLSDWSEEAEGDSLSDLDKEEELEDPDINNLDYDDGFLDQDNVVRYEGDVIRDEDDDEQGMIDGIFKSFLPFTFMLYPKHFSCPCST